MVIRALLDEHCSIDLSGSNSDLGINANSYRPFFCFSFLYKYTFDLLLIYTCHFALNFLSVLFFEGTVCISQFDILGQPSI